MFPYFPLTSIGDISFKDLSYLSIFPLVQVITTEYKNSDHTGFKLLMHVRMKLYFNSRFLRSLGLALLHFLEKATKF